MNVCIISGRLGKDGELRRTQSGDPILSFSLANDIGWGERKTTQWLDCTLFGKRAESLAPYLKKGTKVTAVGEIALRTYEKRDGGQGVSLALRVSEIDLHGSRDDKQDDRDGGSGGYPSGRTGHPADLDDEIPFAPTMIG